MQRSIEHDLVADLYDCYVRWEGDLPFFLELASRHSEPILELTCGTGRVSLPLARAGARLTCVDYAPAMLRVLKEKLLRDHLRANVVCQDMRRLGFAQAFSLVILPFHAFAELVDPEDRALALRSIAGALSPGGRFVCTLHNPAVRRRSVGGEEKEIGRFAGPGPGTELRLYLRTELDARHQIVAGVQRIQVVDRSEQVVDSRIMPMRFALPGRDEVESMAAEAGLEATCLQGDYSGAPFDPVESPFMIWTFTRRTETPSGTSRRPTGDSGGERAC